MGMILKGNCIEVMKALKPNSVDAVVTDPPYGLEFMGKEWDRLMRKDRKVAYPSCRSSHGPDEYKAGLEMQRWHTQWLTEAYRVLKPGGSMLVMGGTRTFHRLACAIEDSGFILKDTLMWIYGSGFPKAQDLGKMIDKRKNWCNPEKFAELIKGKRLEKNISLAQMDKDVCNGTTNYSWFEGRPIGIRLPRLKEYQKIKELLKLDNKWDSYFEEAEREKIGKEKQTASIHHFIPGANHKERIRLDITLPSTPLAKHWNGFKVGGIKPAYEPIIWAVKSPEGSYVDNVLKWGVGAVNVDETRIITNSNEPNARKSKRDSHDYPNGNIFKHSGAGEWNGNKGRFPANIILSHHPECVQVGVKRVKPSDGSGRVGKGTTKGKSVFGIGDKHNNWGYVDKNGLETVENWQCHPDCAVRLLDEQSGDGANSFRKNPSSRNKAFFKNAKYKDYGSYGHNDSGGSSRFFYCAKASRSQRNKGLDCLTIIDIIKIWKEGNTIQEAKLVKLLVDTDTLHARAIEESGTQSKSVSEWSISWFGKDVLERYQKDTGCTIKMKTSSITISQILKYLTWLLTKEYIADVKLLKGNGGSHAVNVEDSNQLIITINEKMASRLGVKNVQSKTQLKINVKEGNNFHPTCKPISLFEYLIKLVTRQGQIILDPFIGSGTTAIAAHNAGRKCVGIEKEGEYLEIAKKRIDYWKGQPKQMEMRI